MNRAKSNGNAEATGWALLKVRKASRGADFKKNLFY